MFQAPEPTAELTLSTPALLFPAISLLLLAYTNRFMGLASLIRDLESKYRSTHDVCLRTQIENLRKRVLLIRNMQVAGVASLFFCVLCMLVLFAGSMLLGKVLFTISLILMLASLGLSLRELQISVGALHVQLRDLENRHDEEGR
ncbi:MAG: DUF2721 domain-containing protein [Halorhodospira halophila]|uniref:DUF2721 domain-containing protein n=1 Tax=Halorhodospira TaxID=85108 RepID=UPI001914CB9B|nr:MULTISPECIES: DUF2721 domain-containing protein [Halorhodospira]MBK5935818.1 hypothetical protein [Halorhodospira halophila]MBK5944572.1 hypothetical protein [Halorhodospira halophila]MCC3751622.1 DUF2721 domain-containing protein [Halorhodospira halophila]MCG5527283.1 DUF2721 domain-containing protein [Halorhodospira halophila]MCG5532490.1 DUF2721 domain-containing protein [Halorhodospira sp. 9621]